MFTFNRCVMYTMTGNNALTKPSLLKTLCLTDNLLKLYYYARLYFKMFG